MRTCFPFLNSNITEKHFVICDTVTKYLLQRRIFLIRKSFTLNISILKFREQAFNFKKGKVAFVRSKSCLSTSNDTVVQLYHTLLILSITKNKQRLGNFPVSLKLSSIIYIYVLKRSSILYIYNRRTSIYYIYT